jgi:uncharacterized protein YkuJ
MTAKIQIKKGGAYNTFDKEFNDNTHLTNWMRVMERKGYKIIGVIPHEDAETKSVRDYIEAQENAPFDNFCRNNNI